MKTAVPYSYFSAIYSHLMKNVDYEYWAQYILEIHQTMGSKNDIALELASGDCSLSKYLKSHFIQLYLSDKSIEMLKRKKNKLPAVCFDMLHLPFKSSFDFIFSTFDSINYINEDKRLFDFFSNIKEYLTPNGYFLFDVSLKSNSLKHLDQLNRKGRFRGIKYEQISQFQEDKSLHINTVLINTREGNLYKEVHIQKIYDFYYYFEVLEKAELFVAECFEAFTFNEANSDSDRVQFIVKRNN